MFHSFLLFKISPFDEDVGLFETLYEYLSSFVHSGSRHIAKVWTNGNGFVLINEHDEALKVVVDLLACFICGMIMQVISRSEHSSGTSRWDMTLFCYSMRKIIEDVGTPDNSELVFIIDKLKRRAKSFPTQVSPFIVPKE